MASSLRSRQFARCRRTCCKQSKWKCNGCTIYVHVSVKFSITNKDTKTRCATTVVLAGTTCMVWRKRQLRTEKNDFLAILMPLISILHKMSSLDCTYGYRWEESFVSLAIFCFNYSWPILCILESAYLYPHCPIRKHARLWASKRTTETRPFSVLYIVNDKHILLLQTLLNGAKDLNLLNLPIPLVSSRD
jgi:hypothetical protein